MSHQVPPLEVFPQLAVFQSPITSIRREATYGFYGPFSSSSFTDSASDFILNHCAADKAKLTQALSSFLDDAAVNARQYSSLSDRPNSTHSAWLCIRVTAPSAEWVMPRWHRDGRMFDCSCVAPRPHAKYAVTLLGPPTRLLRPSEEADALIRAVEARSDRAGHNRAELATAMEGMPLVDLGRGQTVRFTWGQVDAPVHSEPDSSAEERVFVSILFACEAEMRDMCRFRGETYGEESIWVSKAGVA